MKNGFATNIKIQIQNLKIEIGIYYKNTKQIMGENYKLRVHKKYTKRTSTYLASLVEVSPQEILSISYLKFRKNMMFSYEGQGLQMPHVYVSKKINQKKTIKN